MYFCKKKKVSIQNIEEFLDVKATPLKPLAGRILISVPFFNDPFFNRSVVFLIEYDEENCVGLIVNQPINYKVNQVIKDINLDDIVYAGGPVMHNSAFAIHNYPLCDSCTPIINDIYVGYDDHFISFIENKLDSNIKYKFFIGYSGWSPNQLEEELKHKMWVVSHADEKLLLETPAELIWENAVKALGEDYVHWLKIPEHISDN